MEKIKIPRIAGEYIPIYTPKGDVFPGPDSIELKANTYYETWATNDHHMVLDRDGRWHIFGITHPITSRKNAHDGEWLLFHAVSKQAALKDLLEENSFQEEKKILPPSQRPNEARAIHSPYFIEQSDAYLMVYGYAPFRYAVTKNLFDFTPKGNFFKNIEIAKGRDPMILFKEDTFYFLYCTNNYAIEMTTSKNLSDWSEPTIIYQCQDKIHPESPVLKYVDGYFYLFLCYWDESNPMDYQDKTLVVAAKTIEELVHKEPITTLNAHAAEIIGDEQGNTYITSAHRPHRGISIARLIFE